MGTASTITCRDADDPEYWGARLKAQDRKDCEALMDSMLGLAVRRNAKNARAPWVSDRVKEGMDIYFERFGETYVPF
jgi:hypothetical protein